MHTEVNVLNSVFYRVAHFLLEYEVTLTILIRYTSLSLESLNTLIQANFNQVKIVT